MAYELVPCRPGDRWFPWNYRRSRRFGDRVRAARFDPEPGLVVVNAVDCRGGILGSCALRLGYRHSEFVLSDEEYQYGDAAAGPADFWPDDDDPEYDAAAAAFDAESAYAAGSIEGWVTDAEAMRSYATVRCFLRRREWREFATVDDAARELFVSDLSEEPRGLRRFSSLVSPLNAEHSSSG